jgi:hypothetical protein
MAVNTGQGFLLTGEELIPRYDKILIRGVDWRNVLGYEYF